VYFFVFHAYVNEMHGSRSKFPSKKISSDSVARRDLIPSLNVNVVIDFSKFDVHMWHQMPCCQHVVLSAAPPYRTSSPHTRFVGTAERQALAVPIVSDTVPPCIMNLSQLHVGKYFVWSVHAVYSQFPAGLRVWGRTAVRPVVLKL
jgi:hypothetical protein